MNKNGEYNFDNAQQGPIEKLQPNKQRITIRIDTTILDWFRNQVNQAGGGNYQTLINEALREHIQEREGMLERTLNYEYQGGKTS